MATATPKHEVITQQNTPPTLGPAQPLTVAFVESLVRSLGDGAAVSVVRFAPIRWHAVPVHTTQLRIFQRRVNWLWRSVLIRRSQRAQVRCAWHVADTPATET
jgi:hypothetical protein